MVGPKVGCLDDDTASPLDTYISSVLARSRGEQNLLQVSHRIYFSVVDLEKGLCEARSVNEVGSDEEEIGD